MTSALLRTVLLALLAPLASCSASGSGKLEAVTRGSEAFAIRLLDEAPSETGTAGELELTVSHTESETLVEVWSRGSSDLRALCFELKYDAVRYSPLEARSSGLLRGSEEDAQLIELSLLDEAGVLQHGQVLANWDRRSGFSGDGMLATLRFARRPAPQSARSLSAAPQAEASAALTQLTSDAGGTDLFWFYGNVGDYNQDGLVSISDLTPLGLHLGESGPFTLFHARSQIDGDGNGEINISDLTPIGANFGNSVNGGYNLYRSFDPLDYPASGSAASTITPFDSVPFAEMLGDPALNRLGKSVTVLPGIVNEYFWVRPLDSAGAEGIAGNMVLCPAPTTLALSLVTPALSGSGSEEDPYIVEAAASYAAQLLHGIDGDVTASEFSQFFVNYDTGIIDPLPEAPAQWNAETGSVEVLAEAEGRFVLQARYGSDAADNGLYFRVDDPDNVAPLASFSVDVNEGIAPFDVSCDAATSSDSDGTIIRYEWDTNGDGVFETESSIDSLFVTIEQGGEIQLGLRTVDDDEAVSGVFTQLVRSEGWVHIEVGNAGSASAPASPVLRVAAGKPLIAYRNNLNLDMAYAADALGSGWVSTSLSDAFTPRQISMEIIGGNPALAWRRTGGTDDGIYYCRAVDAAGLGFGDRVLLQGGSGSHSPSLAEIDGRPALAYAWHTGAVPRPYTVFYVRASDADGDDAADWDLIGNGQSLFTAAELYLDSASLQQVDTQIPGIEGRPGIFFITESDELMQNWILRFIKAENNAHTEWGFPSPLQAGGAGAIGQLSVCSIVDRPRFVYQNSASHSLSYRTCSDLAAESWGSLYGLLDAGVGQQRGFSNSLANIAGFPALIHYDAINDQLRYIASSSATGEGGWSVFVGASPVVADVGGYDLADPRARYCSLYALGGRPAMAYHDVAAGRLMFTRYHELD